MSACLPVDCFYLHSAPNRFRGVGITHKKTFTMRKTVFLIILTLLPLAAAAQMKFGYLSYSEAIKAMPDYAVMQKNLESLRAQYADETKRSEEEFNEKYQYFLEGQKELATPILRKRQAELQELLEKGVAFKAEADRLLKQAEADMYAPLKGKLAALLQRIGTERGYAFILNTDGDALPFVNPACGEDITAEVVDYLIHNS